MRKGDADMRRHDCLIQASISLPCLKSFSPSPTTNHWYCIYTGLGTSFSTSAGCISLAAPDRWVSFL